MLSLIKKVKWVLDSKNLFHKEIFEELVKERFDEIIELTDETNFDDLMYHFKRNTAKKRFNDFENEIKLFEKIKSGGTKLKEAKKLQNMFKSNVTEVSRGRYKSKEKE